MSNSHRASQVPSPGAAAIRFHSLPSLALAIHCGSLSKKQLLTAEPCRVIFNAYLQPHGFVRLIDDDLVLGLAFHQFLFHILLSLVRELSSAGDYRKNNGCYGYNIVTFSLHFRNDCPVGASPTDWRQELQTGDRQHAQEQIQQEQNINLFRPQRGSVPIQFISGGAFVGPPV